MICVLLLVTGIGILIYAFYRWATLHNDYFAKRNLPFKKPTFLFGNSLGYLLNKYSATEHASMVYNWFPNDKMFGMFDMRTPNVLIRDPDLLKKLTIKDFESFEDHLIFGDEESEDLFATSLGFMKGQRWRDMRATLSPAFTGSKMRQMFELVTECADDMTKYLLKLSAGGENIGLEMKDLFSRYTNDCIATSAFGIRINSFENPENEFLVMAKKSINIDSPLSVIKFLLIRQFPVLMRKLSIELLPKSATKFFTTMVMETMEERKKRGIIRPDTINLLMQVRQGKLIDETSTEKTINDGFATVQESVTGGKASNRQWKDYELVAQCFAFFLAGYDTVANLLVLLTYELSISPNIQQKLLDEIKETENNLKGRRIDYEALQKMKYLDQVVSEGLRKWPINTITHRRCVKDYLCEYGDEEKFLFEKGLEFWIPIYGIHHDPQYYPDPEKFDPDRFSDENKYRILPGTYLPFGLGPRGCIGSRFALMELKIVLYYILLNFSVVPNAKSEIPMRIKKLPFGINPDDTFLLDLIPRKQHTQ